VKHSPYIAWVKSRSGIRWNLAASGVPACSWAALDPGPEDLALAAHNPYGWPPLLERIAARYGVEVGQVVLEHGASMANHLACAAVLEPGDEVLVERPGYEPLHLLPRFLGARVGFFERVAEDGWRLDPDRVRHALTARTRLVILSDLHNPTGARADGAALAALIELAERSGFLVLVDEVYLEWLHGDAAAGPSPATAAARSPRVLATRSLTKAFGLDGLRLGWILAAPEWAERIRALQSLFSGHIAHPSERLGARALDRAERLLAPARERLAANRARVEAFIAAQPRLSWAPPAGGTVGFVRLAGGEVDALVERLERDFDTTVAPGRFFGAPDHFRIGMGMSPEVLEEGLARLGRALA